MSFKAKMIEKAAEHAVQAAAGAVGKHISQKAVDHTISTAKKKVISGYESVREAITESFGDGHRPTTELPTYVLSVHDRQMLHSWFTHGVEAQCFDTIQDRELHKRLCGDL